MRAAGCILCLLVALALVPISASAQRRGEIQLFSETNFQGRTLTLNSARDNLGLPWQVRSVRVVRGEAWDLCTRTRFRSPCHRVAESMSNIRWIVSSARPSLAQTLPQVTPPAGAPSLRGMSAEFFPAPADARGRVEACRPWSVGCEEADANRFCRQRGWTAASYSRQQTVNGINFLADVLCTQTGG